MVSSDIFQEHMDEVFEIFEDVLVYIDNIILYTKSTFDHHVKRIQAVLEVIRQNNLHVHIEKTFLASASVDYLGYTITNKGIMPQTNKNLLLLAFKEPSNLKQLRGFLGLVNYYKKTMVPPFQNAQTTHPLNQQQEQVHLGP
eukprot:9526300-Ditylum_brightwellii.AAC.1